MTGRYERVIQFGKSSLQKLVSSLQRFPETLLLCTATAVVLMLLNHGEPGADTSSGDLLMRLAAVLALGVPLSLCLKVYFERASALKTAPRIAIYTGAAAALILYYLFLIKDFEMVSLTRYAAVSLALYLVFTFIPYFYRRQNYELYVIKLFISFFVTYLFASVLLGGLSAILATVGYLFSMQIPTELYGDISLIVGGIFAPAFFLADIPQSGQDPDPKSYPKVIGILLSYIMMPLILAYSIILYLYFIKILVAQQWPEIMVSHLVLWYAIISTLVLFGIHPQRKESRWNEIFTAFFPKLVLPLLALMFAAMGIRIHAYGITENRYFVLAAGLWVTGAMLYLILTRKPRNLFLPASLALVAVLSVFGPWSSYALSVYSQNRQFDKIAAEHDLIQDGKIADTAADLPEDTKQELSSILLYFDRYHGLDRLQALPEGFSLEEMETLLGFPIDEYTLPGDQEEVYFHYSLDTKEAFFDISDFDYFMHFTSVEQRYHAGALEAAYSPEGHELKIVLHGEPVYSKNVAAIAEKLHYGSAGTLSEDLLSKERATHVDHRDDLKLFYVFEAISGWDKRATGETTIDYLDFYLFVKLENAEP